jgi:Zinc finger, C3HC4 type (RING finger)
MEPEPEPDRAKLDSESGIHDVFTCTICHGISWNPVVTPCGHVFCRSCLMRSLAERSVCPNDRMSLLATEVQDIDGALRRIYLALQVLCPHCQWKGIMDSYESHACISPREFERRMQVLKDWLAAEKSEYESRMQDLKGQHAALVEELKAKANRAEQLGKLYEKEMADHGEKTAALERSEALYMGLIKAKGVTYRASKNASKIAKESREDLLAGLLAGLRNLQKTAEKSITGGVSHVAALTKQLAEKEKEKASKLAKDNLTEQSDQREERAKRRAEQQAERQAESHIVDGTNLQAELSELIQQIERQQQIEYFLEEDPSPSV